MRLRCKQQTKAGEKDPGGHCEAAQALLGVGVWVCGKSSFVSLAVWPVNLGNLGRASDAKRRRALIGQEFHSAKNIIRIMSAPHITHVIELFLRPSPHFCGVFVTPSKHYCDPQSSANERSEKKRSRKKKKKVEAPHITISSNWRTPPNS